LVLDVSVLFNVVTSSLNVKKRRKFYYLIKGYLNKTTKKLCVLLLKKIDKFEKRLSANI
jgi:hypothetical protein